ncbi:unnamed protein product [Notodromas monacha]|uniref:Cwf19-like C-terminal domain-containing protein n=1 Tax=Notodromas monacha TaxID=399045 RepID=A0A7R9BL76_9CRUS|nr:unnamed protein product [Notodromas monacha]CAG0916211.1 unnamed protein product [Notodromas monacha]
MDSKTLRILIAGDVGGNYDKLLKRVNTVNKKAGPFDMLVCVGRFFGSASPGADLRALRSGIHSFPLSTYVLSPSEEFNSGSSGEEICANLINLGSMGVYKTGGGLKIAYCGRVANESEVKAFIGSVLETERGIDILLTCHWPENVMEFASDPDKMNRLDSQLCSRVVSCVARALKPRYHFAALQNIFFERLPYRNHRILAETETNVSRFFGLATCASSEKWLYAFNIVPMISCDPKTLRVQPLDVTENPFLNEKYSWGNLAMRESKAEVSKQYFYDFGGRDGSSINRKGRKSDNKRLNDSDSSTPVKRHVQTPCWFCLSSPEVAKHLVITVGENIYLALAKGGLVPGHVIILPIEHFRALYVRGENENLIEEVETMKVALLKYFASINMSCVFFERNYKSNHSQLHAVPIPLDNKDANCEEIITRIQDSGVSNFKVLSKFADLKQIIGDGSFYLFIELPDGRRVFGKLPPFERGVDDSHILMLMNGVLADILDVQDRLDWRKCTESVEEETEKRDRFVTAFAPFDPFA